MPTGATLGLASVVCLRAEYCERAAPGGAAIGLAFGVATRLVLKWMHRRGHKAPEQLALTVAVPFLSFYVANGPCARMTPPAVGIA